MLKLGNQLNVSTNWKPLFKESKFNHNVSDSKNVKHAVQKAIKRHKFLFEEGIQTNIIKPIIGIKEVNKSGFRNHII